MLIAGQRYCIVLNITQKFKKCAIFFENPFVIFCNSKKKHCIFARRINNLTLIINGD